jgi:hypothetical protein
MAEPNATQTRQQLQQLEEEHGELRTQLSIVRISEPIFSPEADSVDISLSKRNSDVSALDNPSPASLDADLTHYKVRVKENTRTHLAAKILTSDLGIVLKAAILICRTGNKGEVLTCDCW